MSRKIVCLLGLSFLVALGCVEYSLSRSVAASAPIVVILPADVAPERPEQLLAQTPDVKVRLVETQLNETVRRQQQNLANSPDGAWRAFTVPGSGVFEIIVVEAIKQKKAYTIQGLPVIPRPFSNLVWVEGTKLSFDRWSNPHFGYRYLVDMKTMELVDVVSIAS